MDTLEQMGVQRWRLRSRNNFPTAKPAAFSVEAPAEDHPVPVASDELLKAADSSLPEPVTVGVTAEKSISESASEQSLAEDSVIDAVDQILAVVATSSTAHSSTTHPSVTQDPQLSWQDLAAKVENNQNCESCRKTHPVLGDGNLEADWVFIIDAPTAKDMQYQQLLSGRSGQLFDAILQAVGQTRESIYLSSVFKCPASSDLSLTAQCGDLIHQQLALIKPKVVMTLGEFAAQYILRSNDDLSSLRSVDHRSANDTSTIISSYAIADMLEKPLLKADFWRDLQKCLEYL